MMYVFDVDNTLVASSFSMTDEMAALFKAFVGDHPYVLSSGSDLKKMKTQVPADILENAYALFPVMGGEMWVNGEMKYQRTFTWPEGLKSMLESQLEASDYEVRTGEHIQDRTTMVCFSTVGKAATPEERSAYVEYESIAQERTHIADQLRRAFPGLSITIGGQISIDISEEGNDKGQVLAVLRKEYKGPITFFGDKIYEGGNDYPLAVELEKETGNTIVKVQDWLQTRELMMSATRLVA
ncbi:MAG: HAD-IIB family hydrolase [Alphaproteobacteria bacterium]|nr:HAD-IIB family hydrolase [Alphaproteobacteria bacterium]